MSGKQADFNLQDCLAGAFQALLRGDTVERDKLCALAERAFETTGKDVLPGDTSVLIEKGKLS